MCFDEILGQAFPKIEETYLQSSTRILFVGPQKLVARRTTTADVASRRQRTPVTTNTGLSEYGSTKFDVTPDGGAIAAAEVLLFIRLPMPMVNPAVKRHAKMNIWKDKGDR